MGRDEGRDGTISVRAGHGSWAAGWRLFGAGVARTLTHGRRTVLLVSLGVVVVVFAVALLRAIGQPGGVPVLVAVFALLAFLVVGLELVVWSLLDRRRIAEVDVDRDRMTRVRAEIRAGRASIVDPAERRALSRFGRVQQLTLPATVLLHMVGAVVFLVVVVTAIGSGNGFVVVLGVVLLAINVVSIVGTVRALGTTPELVALDDPV